VLTVSLVTFHNKLEQILAAIDSFKAFTGSYRIYIIDNSSDDALSVLASDHVIYYRNPSNIGFGAAHNVGIRMGQEAGSKYHIILNPDITIKSGCLKKLLVLMENHLDVGLVQPQIRYPDGEIQKLCKLIPSPADLILRRFIPFKGWKAKRVAYYELHETGYDHTIDVPSLSGCFMFIRAEVLNQVGGFDPRYFMYLEDLDLCRRIGEIFRTVFYPEAEVIHEYAKGSYKNKKLLKYHIQSAIKYFNKWGWFFDHKRTSKNRETLERLGLK